jgi:hypothetical protein
MPDETLLQSFTVPRLLPLLVIAEALSLSPHTIRSLVRRGMHSDLARSLQRCKRCQHSDRSICRSTFGMNFRDRNNIELRLTAVIKGEKLIRIKN